MWQQEVFSPCLWITNDIPCTVKTVFVSDGTDRSQRELILNDTRAEDEAMRSYAQFLRLRDRGIIDPSNNFQTRIEPLYEEKLLQSLYNMQAHIPPPTSPSNGTAPWNSPFLKTSTPQTLPPWFEPTPENVFARMRISDAVNQDVKMGAHLCHGDQFYGHLVQPKDMGKLVDLSNRVLANVTHTIRWLRMPVPKDDRNDDAYFAPLKELKIPVETEVYLGLVHVNDVDGTRAQIETGKKFLEGFGIATECGLGRTPVQDAESIFDILKEMGASVANLLD